MPGVAEIVPQALATTRDAALSRTPVSLGPRRTSSVHEFYRYPARFSPGLAASIIETFSRAGDLVIDPFIGGGTTAVEARLLSRYAIGADINSLATFVSRVKTRTYSGRQIDEVTRWADTVSSYRIPANFGAIASESLHYFNNFTGEDLEPQRMALLGALGGLSAIEDDRARDLARCVVLRTAQWAFDMRDEIPSREQFQSAIGATAHDMVAIARVTTQRYRAADRSAQGNGAAHALILDQELPGLASHRAVATRGAPRLILTSPPYPGVYVNYHRWKVRGRRETPLPYFISGQLDGHGLAHYTMAARADKTLEKYFARLKSAFVDVASLADEHTWLVQVVGFNRVEDQLPRYLLCMEQAGFTEYQFSQLATDSDGRLWRDVPGRRWWARAGDRSIVVPQTAREVVLVHRLRG